MPFDVSGSRDRRVGTGMFMLKPEKVIYILYYIRLIDRLYCAVEGVLPRHAAARALTEPPASQTPRCRLPEKAQPVNGSEPWLILAIDTTKAIIICKVNSLP